MGQDLVYPVLPPSERRWADRLALKGITRGGRKYFGPIRCTVCGEWAFAMDFGAIPGALRETGACSRCSASNRHRQLAYVTASAVTRGTGRSCTSLREVTSSGLRIHNAESGGPVHRMLHSMADYSSSEYFGPQLLSGDMVDGVMHQDLHATSFADESVDLLLTSDVFEHVADPYRAHREIWRILRPSGRHIFTIPFKETEFLDERRASLDADGQVVHHLEPVFHGDPVRPAEGALVFMIFSLEMLVRLGEIGFETRMHWLHKPRYGIVGQEATVFEAVKPPT